MTLEEKKRHQEWKEEWNRKNMENYLRIKADNERRAKYPSNYRIEMVDKYDNTKEIPMRLAQNSYDVMFDLVRGIAIGYLHGTGRKRASMLIWEIDKEGNKIELIDGYN